MRGQREARRARRALGEGIIGGGIGGVWVLVWRGVLVVCWLGGAWWEVEVADIARRFDEPRESFWERARGGKSSRLPCFNSASFYQQHPSAVQSTCGIVMERLALRS